VLGDRRSRAGGERTHSIIHEGMLALPDARVGSLPRGYRAQSGIASHGLQSAWTGGSSSWPDDSTLSLGR
jgi:hypothetical protein